MKTRTGFVSNSSASSFALPLASVTEEQLAHIRDHIRYAKEQWPNKFDDDDWDAWTIYVTEERVIGYTMMDNFDMLTFLRYLGISEEFIKPNERHEDWDAEDQEP